MKKLKVAVIGVGHLGRFHAEKYQQLADIELVAVCDADKKRCTAVAETLKVMPVYDFRELIDQVDAVSIVTPTMTHYAIAKQFLEAGVHVLLEKPITETLDEAQDLIQTALKKQVVFQIGHIERFNPAVIALEKMVNKPLLIESIRTGPFQPRNLDVSVVQDLMIHDIDIIQSIHPVPIKKIDALGFSIMTDSTDVANVRLTFEDGCVANLTANRTAPKKERNLKVYQADAHIFVDCQAQTVAIYRRQGEMQDSLTEHPIQKTDTLADQIQSFIAAIRLGNQPKVGGEQGRKALETALEIRLAMLEREWVF